jgi:pimeloyl-ACP methyl ester carboxylesterase
MLGLSFAAIHPDRVGCVVLVGCGTYDEDCRKRMHERLDEQLGEDGRRRIAHLTKQRHAEADPRTRDAIAKERAAVFMRAEAYNFIDEPEPLQDALPADDEGNRQTWEDVLRLQKEGMEPNRFDAIYCPVLMLHGDYDPHPGKQTRDVLRRFIPQLEYVEFEKCGHEPWKERHARDLFFNALRTWLTKNHY